MIVSTTKHRSWGLLCSLVLALNFLLAFSADAKTYEFTLNSLGCTKVASKEPGTENEFFGHFSVMYILGDKGAYINVPKSGKLGLWNVKDSRTFNVKEGQSRGIGKTVKFDLSDGDIKNGTIFVGYSLMEHDTTSRNDLIGNMPVYPIKFKGRETGSETIKLSADGDAAEFVFSWKPETTTEFDASSRTASNKVEKDGAKVVKFSKYNETVKFPKLASQQPVIQTVLDTEIMEDSTKDRYLLVDLAGTLATAAIGGNLDLDTSGERGYFLSKLDVTIAAPNGFTVVKDAPATAQKSGSSTTSVGASFGVDASLSGAGGSGTFSVNTSQTQTYADFEVTNTGTNPKKHSYRLAQTEGKPYRQPKDLAYTIETHLNELPQRAKANLPIQSWVVFQAPQTRPGYSKKAQIKVSYVMELTFVDLDGATWKSQTKTYKKSVTLPVDFSLLD